MVSMTTNTTEVMKASRTCDRCGAIVPPSAPQALCLRCLFDTAVDSSDDLLSEHVAGGGHPEFSDYELLGELGRGGQGVVYRARHKKLSRLVALKTIPSAHVSGPNARERFLHEANTAARLDHPNIVPIYEVGDREGFCFFSMKLIEGTTVQELSSQALPNAAGCRHAATILLKVARAVHHAHQRGVLHRDLKPSNILLDIEREPLVTDFGLACQIDQDSSLTLTQTIIGTPAYLAPEVASGGAPQATVAADIYGLGAIFYEMLTGHPPFGGGTLAELLRAVQDQEPPRLGSLNRAVPRDLEIICLKCLEKEPQRRYQTAQELADDLDRFLKDEPIQARPIGPTARLWRWCRRKPALASSLLVILILFLIVIVGSPIAAYRINRERRVAELRAYTSDMNLVQQAWDEGNFNRAHALLRSHIPKPGQPDLRGFEWRYLWKLCQDESQFSFTNFTSAIRLALSPDHRIAAAGSGSIVRLLDFANNREIGSFPDPNATGAIDALAFSPANSNVLATASGHTLKLWRLSERRATATITLSNAAVALAISRDGKLLAAASGDEQTLELWRLDNNSMLWMHQTPTQPFAIAFAPDGKSLLSGGDEHCNPLLWDANSGQSVGFSPERQGWINSMEFSPDGKVVATASTDGTVILWDYAQRKPLARLTAFGGGSTQSIAFSPDGRWLVAACDGARLLLWDVAARQQKAIYRGHHGEVTGVGFSPDSHWFLTSSEDRTVKVWRVQPRADREILGTNETWAAFVKFSPDGRTLVSSGVSLGGLAVWDLATRQRIAQLTQPSTNMEPAAVFSPNSEILAQMYGNRIKLWDARTLAARGELTNDFDAVSLSFSPDNRTLAAAGLATRNLHGITKRLTVWDVTTKKKLDKLAAAAELAVIVSFSHDGKLLAIGYLNGEVRLWDFQDDRMIKEFTDQHDRIWCLAFSPDDTRPLAGGEEGKVVFHDLRERQSSPPVTATSAWILGLSFTPDGRTLASAEGDGTIKLWNSEAREVALTLRAHQGQCTGVSFSPDGNLLASCGSDGTVRLWPAAPFNKVPQSVWSRQ